MGSVTRNGSFRYVHPVEAQINQPLIIAHQRVAFSKGSQQTKASQTGIYKCKKFNVKSN